VNDQHSCQECQLSRSLPWRNSRGAFFSGGNGNPGGFFFWGGNGSPGETPFFNEKFMGWDKKKGGGPD